MAELTRKNLMQKLDMPIGKKAKQKLDQWITENIAEPSGGTGYEDAAAALSATLSAGGELLIPDDLADAAMAAVPGVKLAKSAAKGMKALKKADDAIGPAGTVVKKAEPPTLNYADIFKKDMKKKQAAAQSKGSTLRYPGDKKIVEGDSEWRKQVKRLEDKAE